MVPETYLWILVIGLSLLLVIPWLWRKSLPHLRRWLVGSLIDTNGSDPLQLIGKMAQSPEIQILAKRLLNDDKNVVKSDNHDISEKLKRVVNMAQSALNNYQQLVRDGKFDISTPEKYRKAFRTIAADLYREDPAYARLEENYFVGLMELSQKKENDDEPPGLEVVEDEIDPMKAEGDALPKPQLNLNKLLSQIAPDGQQIDLNKMLAGLMAAFTPERTAAAAPEAPEFTD